MKIDWIKEEDDFYKSKDGRFNIIPNYLGRTKAVSFTLVDNKTNRKFSSSLGIRHLKKMAEYPNSTKKGFHPRRNC